MNKVIFPDLEKTIVNGLQSLLDGRTEPMATDVYVATKKPPTDFTPYPEKIITVRDDGGADLDGVRRLSRIGINVWATDYATASGLAHLINALKDDLVGDEIKWIKTNLSPTRLPEESQEEHRYLVWEVVVKATNL